MRTILSGKTGRFTYACSGECPSYALAGTALQPDEKRWRCCSHDNIAYFRADEDKYRPKHHVRVWLFFSSGTFHVPCIHGAETHNILDSEDRTSLIARHQQCQCFRSDTHKHLSDSMEIEKSEWPTSRVLLPLKNRNIQTGEKEESSKRNKKT